MSPSSQTPVLEASTTSEGCLPALRVREYMTLHPANVQAALSVGAALGVLNDEGLLGLPLIAEGRLRGTVTAASLLEPIVVAYEQSEEIDVLLDALDTPVGEIVDEEEDVATCTDSDSLTAACQVMERAGLSALPVTCRGELVGVLTAGDIVRAVSKLVRPLEPVSAGPQVVGAWMTRQVLTVDHDDPVSVALHVMAQEGVRHLIVTDEGALCGVLSNGDVLRAARGSRGKKLELDLQRRTVKEIMTSSPIHTTTPESPLKIAAASMSNHRVNSLPVMDGQRVVGVLTSRDLLAALCACSP
jgi:acetoin utilization protein AcuB